MQFFNISVLPLVARKWHLESKKFPSMIQCSQKSVPMPVSKKKYQPLQKLSNNKRVFLYKKCIIIIFWTEAAFCFPQKYRTPNGECNNVKNPMWGMTGAAYLRLKEPEYEDGVGTPRKMSRQGSKLPDALAVSSQLMWTHNDPHDFITALAAIWGQFVANDIRYVRSTT